MQRQSLLYYILASVSVSLTFCKHQTEGEHRVMNAVVPADFVKEVPIKGKGTPKQRPDYTYIYTNREASKLYLDSLETGYDSLQLRIWLGHSLAGVKHVVILKYTKSAWKGQLVAYSHGKQRSIAEKNVINIIPKSGWSNFTKTLFDLGVLSLPHEDDLLGYSGCGTDGISYNFEWATSRKYRFYNYCNPEDNVNEFWQARNVLKIADLLDREFGFKYIK